VRGAGGYCIASAVHVLQTFDIDSAIKYTKSCCVGDTWMPEIRTAQEAWRGSPGKA